MLTALGYFGEFLDLRKCRYESHYIILTEQSLQCVVKTGRKYQILSREQKTEKWKTVEWYNCCFPFHHTYIFLWCLCMLQKFELLKLYAKYILLIPRSCCIFYWDFNVNNAFKCILFPSSVQVYYSTETSGLYFLIRQENCSILMFKYYRLKLLSLQT
jgi:hypothetical protein